MTIALMMALDIVAILLLTFAIYFPRHHRGDLVVAFLGVNVGVLGVSTMLTSADVSLGFGLGLFGVLSIIRLRSSEISQREIAYFFASLAIGLICGLTTTVHPAGIATVVAIVATLALADSPRVFGSYANHEVVLDRAVANPAELSASLEELLGAEILGVTVDRIDLVNDTTWVSVRTRNRPRTHALTQSAARGRNEELPALQQSEA